MEIVLGLVHTLRLCLQLPLLVLHSQEIPIDRSLFAAIENPRIYTHLEIVENKFSDIYGAKKGIQLL